jgi:DNA-binding PadR family transcriptional regulator
MLTVEPMSGYDIKKFIETSVAHFWRESYGNIYPLLNRLTEEKLVRRRTQRQKGRPDRHVYSLTARGRTEFLEWLGEPVEAETVRSELLLKLFFGRHLATERLESHLEEYREHQTRLLAALRGTREMLDRNHADHPDLRYWLLTLRRGELVARARLQWARESLHGFAKNPGKK